jgi:hypothetical protein
MEADQVLAKARQDGNTAHCWGRLFELVHEAGSELDDGDPQKQMKGRCLLLGDIIWCQGLNWAVCL